MKCHGKLKQNINKYFRCSVCVFPVSDLPIVLAGVSQGFVYIYIYKSLLKPRASKSRPRYNNFNTVISLSYICFS